MPPPPTQARTEPGTDPRREPAALPPAAAEAIQRVWGFSTLRPLQTEAIAAALDRRDALVVLPTGGGKSLCYQAPPLVDGDLTVVISPLISLMKDQVDGLRLNGYPAFGLHSACTEEETAEARAALAAGEARLLFVSPERLLAAGFLDWLRSLRQPSGARGVRRFAIDEAHCISHWGHDFRPEYRRLATLRTQFPEACVHAFTATATERVREDIVSQLGLREPEVLVGTFDRPNLVYRVVPRVSREAQIAEVVARHAGEATIVYCISRRDTEAVADVLRSRGVNASHYHAGMEPDERRRVQEDFSRERLDVVVATVAFGMGIDRSNVRCVLHAAMPKSIEAYQQETGRAGRDGLEAECVLLYSGGDAERWKQLFLLSAESAGSAPDVLDAQFRLLDEVQRFAAGMNCRHRTLSEHFGQPYPFPNCNACDVCLDEVDPVEDATVVAQKIISCVARAAQHSGGGFGAAHIVDVLRGSRARKILERGHDRLSTFGLLRDVPRPTLVSYVNQLIDQGVLLRAHGEFPTLALCEDSLEVLRGRREVDLKRPRQPVRRRATREEISLTPEEHALFDALRELRRAIADERAVPPYVVFSDDALTEMSAARPGSRETMAHVRGVGAQKLESFGDAFIQRIREWCRDHGLDLDARQGSSPPPARAGGTAPGATTPGKARTFAAFERGESVEAAARSAKLAASTVSAHLAEWIETHAPDDVSPWVSDDDYRRIAAAAHEAGLEFLRPIRDRLGDDTPYEAIRVVVAHLKSRHTAG